MAINRPRRIPRHVRPHVSRVTRSPGGAPGSGAGGANFSPDPIIALIQHEVAKWLQQFGDRLVGALKVKIGIQGPPRSRPGQPPHMDTTALEQSIQAVYDIFGVDDMTAEVSVGTPIDYGFYLEFGTWKMAARPWLRTTLDEVMADAADDLEIEMSLISAY